MADAIVAITDKAKAILVFEKELTEVNKQIEAERVRHAKVLAEEHRLHEMSLDVLLTRRQAMEQSIFRLGQLGS